MPRRRRSRRAYLYRPLKTAKYSNETYAFASTLPYGNGTSYVVVSPSTTTLGTRKAKNFTLTFFCTPQTLYLWALLFVPEGTRPNPLNWGTQQDPQTNDLLAADLYNPSQNVIMQGLVGGYNPSPSQVLRFKTRLARNLNSGDSLILAMRPLSSYEGSASLVGTLNYAISY